MTQIMCKSKTGGSVCSRHWRKANGKQQNPHVAKVLMMLAVLSCAVDTTEAGIGDLDIDVICKDTRIPTQSQPLGHGHHRYMFVPMSPHNHVVNVKFNMSDIPGMCDLSLL